MTRSLNFPGPKSRPKTFISTPGILYYLIVDWKDHLKVQQILLKLYWNDRDTNSGSRCVLYREGSPWPISCSVKIIAPPDTLSKASTIPHFLFFATINSENEIGAELLTNSDFFGNLEHLYLSEFVKYIRLHEAALLVLGTQVDWSLDTSVWRARLPDLLPLKSSLVWRMMPFLAVTICIELNQFRFRFCAPAHCDSPNPYGPGLHPHPYLLQFVFDWTCSGSDVLNIKKPHFYLQFSSNAPRKIFKTNISPKNFQNGFYFHL